MPRLSTGLQNIFWALSKSWGGRLITFGVFLVVARLVPPAEYGLAAASATVLLAINTLAPLGFGEALVQRQDLKDEDANAPFWISTALALVATAACVWQAHLIAGLFGLPALEGIVRWSVLIAPVNVVATYQEYFYRRQLLFRELALRTFAANMLGGAVAILLAWHGAGVWSLVSQVYATTLVSLVWLWAKPLWRPRWVLRWQSFRALGRFAASISAKSVLDILVTRFIEVYLARTFGAAGLGFYAVGSRLYTVLMQLLQGALNDVLLSLLSRQAHDKARMAQLYKSSTLFSAVVGSGVMAACAALSPEITQLLFGARWHGVGLVSGLLLGMAAVQVVQFLNGAYLNAVGVPQVILQINLLRLPLLGLIFWLLPASDVGGAVLLYVICQLSTSHLSFMEVSRQLHMSLKPILQHFGKVLGLLLLAGAAAAWGRTVLAQEPLLLRLPVLGLMFVAVYGAGLLLCMRGELSEMKAFLSARLQLRGRSAAG